MNLSLPLPDLRIPSKENQFLTEMGTDSLSLCLDLDHFKNYPFDVTYQFNSRGFRDQEWPEDLTNCIWCLGDSATVGVATPLSHTWVNLLQAKTQTRCINISLEGASNQWISRRAVQILNEIKPQTMVINWSYFHRSENSDTSKSDEDRRNHYDVKLLDLISQIRSFNESVDEVLQAKGDTNVVFSQCPMPGFFNNLEKVKEVWEIYRGFSWPKSPTNLNEFLHLPKLVKYELKKINVYEKILALMECIETPEYVKYQKYLNNIKVIPEIKVIDLARDNYHYDIKTSTHFVNQILPLI